jgi:hypothetical protein
VPLSMEDEQFKRKLLLWHNTTAPLGFSVNIHASRRQQQFINIPRKLCHLIDHALSYLINIQHFAMSAIHGTSHLGGPSSPPMERSKRLRTSRDLVHLLLLPPSTCTPLYI